MYDLILAIVKCIETNVILRYTRTEIIIIIIYPLCACRCTKGAFCTHTPYFTGCIYHLRLPFASAEYTKPSEVVLFNCTDYRAKDIYQVLRFQPYRSHDLMTYVTGSDPHEDKKK